MDDVIGGLGFSGEEQDGHFGHFSQAAACLKAIHGWHHDIQEDGIRMSLVSDTQPRESILGGHDLKALGNEQDLEHFKDLGLIVDDQDPELALHN
jgi:hypothetical protein